ncbi:uncharacterized protein LOC129966038 isoform X2 [Argiope bruennichi]|uniref:uncharacterized protein LOC129966038 isoform X2 n=1 Tax=Argiope bruennichi TaxID=94029 RepID=UPI002494375E|nr:uncharacterized protein LOC129966038 isoform X2 [Argiope bruennichi]
MKTQIFFVPFSILILCVHCARCGGYKEAIESCNEYVDKLLNSIVVDQADTLDPYHINDTVISFQKKIVFVDFKGEAKLSEGYITGISSLRRTEPCSLSFEKGRYILSTSLRTTALFFNFTGSVKMMNMGPEIFVRGNSSSAHGSMAFSLNATTGKEAILEEFKLQYVKDMQVWIDGLRLLKWMSDPLRNSAAIFFKHSVKKLVEVVIGSSINDEMMKNPFSIEEFDIDVKEITAVTGDTEFTTPKDDDTDLPNKKNYVVEDSDSYIDSVLENRYFVEISYGKLDPYILDDDRIENAFIQRKKNRDKSIANNYLDLKKGKLENLSRLKRITDCTKPLFRSKNVTFECYLGFDELQMKYDATSYLENQVSKFELIASIVNTRLKVKVTSSYKDNVPNLQDFTILNNGKVTVKSARVIADTYLASSDSPPPYNQDAILEHFYTLLLKILNGRFKEALSYSIYKTPIHFLNM